MNIQTSVKRQSKVIRSSITKYATQEVNYDKTTGLYYLNARYYDPANSRFLSLDTYRGENDYPQSLHLYAYTANNPINFTDPSGHKRTGKNTKLKSYMGKSLYAKIKKYLRKIPTKNQHYNRNQFNTSLPQRGDDAIKWGYEYYKKPKDNCHQFTAAKGKRNKKYVKKAKTTINSTKWKHGYKEVVYNSSGKIINDSRDVGTFNFAKKYFPHAVWDVAPYIVWGNAADDSTSQSQRLKKTLGLPFGKRTKKVIQGVTKYLKS